MYEKVNKMQFIHKIELATLTKSVLKTADENNVTEADICILAGMLHCMHDKSNADVAKLLTETLLFNKVEVKRMKASDSFEIERIKYLSKNFFTNFTSTRLSQAFNVPLNTIEMDNDIKYNHFILMFLTDNYSGDDDDTIIEEFMKSSDVGNYADCVRIYLMTLVLGRFKLLEKLSIIQNKTFNKNFLYALNQELIRNINFLVRYGRGNKIDILSEEVIDMCNSALDELTTKLSDIQYEHVMETTDLNFKLKEANDKIADLEETLSKLLLELEEYKNVKVLDGKKVLVIADENHREGYKEIIERHGGIFEFISGVNTNVPFVVNRARANDEVFFCTAYTKHKLFYAGIKDIENLHYVTTVGLDSLERAVINIK